MTEGQPTTQDSADIETDASPSSSISSRESVFLSYAHADAEKPWFLELAKYLKLLGNADHIEFWSDVQIKPGQDWADEIDRALQDCQVAVIALSASSVGSDFIRSSELPVLLERQLKDGLEVYPLICESIDLTSAAIPHLLRNLAQSKQMIVPPGSSLQGIYEESPDKLQRTLSRLNGHIETSIGHTPAQDPEVSDKIKSEIQRAFNGQISERIPGGDSSLVYKLSRNENTYIVKSYVTSKLASADQKEIEGEFEKAKSLSHPSFIRTRSYKMSDPYFLTLVDFVNGMTLRRYSAMGGFFRSREETDRRYIDYNRITRVLLNLSEAITEAADQEVKFLMVNPNEILIDENDRPYVHPINFSQWLSRREAKGGTLRTSLKAASYFSPEEYFQPTSRTRAVSIAKTYQYWLGLTGLHMLERRPRISVRTYEDMRRFEHFFDNTREHIRKSDWFKEAPGLGRILIRMLAKDPADRWESLEMMSLQLESLISLEMVAHKSEAKEYYRTRMVGNTAFYADFYGRFRARNKKIDRLFKKTDAALQGRMLDVAIERLLNFREDQEEPTTLSSIAREHRKYGGKRDRIVADDIEHFAEAFFETLRGDGAEETLIDSWEAVLRPGLNYLREKICHD